MPAPCRGDDAILNSTISGPSRATASAADYRQRIKRPGARRAPLMAEARVASATGNLAVPARRCSYQPSISTAVNRMAALNEFLADAVDSAGDLVGESRDDQGVQHAAADAARDPFPALGYAIRLAASTMPTTKAASSTSRKTMTATANIDSRC